jgi:hypothetical protein
MFVTLAPNKTLIVKGNPCSEGKSSKERIMVMLACSAVELTDFHHSPLVIGEGEN